MASSSWQDRFRKERSAKNALAQQVKDLNAALVQFQKTSLATSTATGKHHNGYTKEETNFIHDLKSRNQALLGENKRLKGKLKCAFFTVQRLKQQVVSFKQRLKGSGYLSFGNSLPGEGCSTSPSPSARASASTSPRTHHVLEQKLKAALEENQMISDENNRLKDLDSYKSSNKISTRTAAKVEFANDESALQSVSEDRDPHPRLTQAQLLEQLREAMDAAKVMKVEYGTLESTSQVQLHMHKKTRARLEQCNAYIRKLQHQINDLQSVKLVTKKEYVRLDQYKQHVDELMGENTRLEDKLANLCDLPFVQSQEEEEAVVNVQDQYYMDELQDLENELDRHKHQVDVLTNANLCLEAHLDALEDENHSLRSSCDDLQEQIGCLDNEFAQYRDNKRNNQRQMWTQCSMFDEDCPATRTHIEEKSSIDKLHISSSLLPSGTDRLILLAKIDILQHASIRQLTQLPLRERGEQISFVEKQDSQNIRTADKTSLDPGQEEVMLKASVIRCQLDHPSIDEDTKNMLVMTFLNFEPMISIIATGRDPNYEFSVSSSLKRSWFSTPESVEYLKFKFEIFKTSGTVLESIGHARIHAMDLQSLLKEHQAQLILDLISQGQKIGFLNVDLEISPLEPTSTENGFNVG